MKTPPRTVSRTAAILAASVAALVAGTAMAAAPAPPPVDRLAVLEQRLEQNQRTIEALAAQVQALQAQLAQRPGTAPATPGQAAPPAAADDATRLAIVEREVEQMTTAAAHRSGENNGLPLHGFADVGLGNHNPNTADLKGATVGSLDFYLAPQLGANTRGLVELNFEVGDDGHVGADLERAQLGYQLGNAGTAWVGRFHTPYGYYNTAFHHGQQIATGLRRPRFLGFEDQGGILPAHTVGLWFSGTQRTGEGRMSYDLYVGNAQSVRDGVLDANSAGTTDGDVVAGGKLGFSPGGAFYGLQLGLSVLHGQIRNEQVVADSASVTAFGLHAAWDSDRWENLAEYYAFRDQAIGGGNSHASHAGFVQLGWRAGAWTPYVRYELAQLDQQDGYFAGQSSGGSYHREALGLRLDIDLKSALKLELADTHFTDRTPYSYGDVLMQYAIRF